MSRTLWTQGLMALSVPVILCLCMGCGVNDTYSPTLGRPAVVTPTFTLSATPASRTLNPGQTTTYTVTVTAVNGFNSAVSLTVTGLPAGTDNGFVPAAVTPTQGGATSVLTVTTTANTPTGTFTLRITGSGGGVTHQVTVTLTVAPVSVPNSAKIVFSTDRDTIPGAATPGHDKIFVRNPDGTFLKLAQTNIYDGDKPRFSPDGSMVVYQASFNGRTSIRVTPSDGTGNSINVFPRGLPFNGPSNLSTPSFSPDGTQILFDFSDNSTNGKSRIAIMDRDGNNAKFLTASGVGRDPVFNPAGNTIVFAGDLNGISAMNPDGSNVRLLTRSITGLAYHAPRFSPDGSKIVFEASNLATGQQASDVWIMNADGTNPHPLTTDGKSFSPGFQGNGHIVFASKRDGPGDLYVMDTGGGNVARLTTTTDAGAGNLTPDSQ